MDTNRPLTDIATIATNLLRGTAPLAVALATWQKYHKLRLEDVSAHLGEKGRSPGAVSAMLHNPARCPGTRREVEELIGYKERDPT